MRDRILLFVVSCILGGLGALLGSILGNAAGRVGLFTGGVLGGLVGAFLSGVIALKRGWIGPERLRPTVLGATIGFFVAVLIATQTLGSPIGPILSTGLIGVGALLGAGRHRDARQALKE